MTARWDTPSALAGLLDALESDLLGASAEELRAALRETGRVKESAVHELKSLLRNAETDGRNRYLRVRPADERDGLDEQRD